MPISKQFASRSIDHTKDYTMSREISQAKYMGFQLGIEIAKQLQQQEAEIDLNEAIKLAREIADREFTTTDPERRAVFDEATENYCRYLAMKSIDAQQKHASDVCDGLVSLIDSMDD